MMILEGLAMRPDKHDMQCDHCGSDNDNLKNQQKHILKFKVFTYQKWVLAMMSQLQTLQTCVMMI